MEMEIGHIICIYITKQSKNLDYLTTSNPDQKLAKSKASYKF